MRITTLFQLVCVSAMTLAALGQETTRELIVVDENAVNCTGGNCGRRLEGIMEHRILKKKKKRTPPPDDEEDDEDDSKGNAAQTPAAGNAAQTPVAGNAAQTPVAGNTATNTAAGNTATNTAAAATATNTTAIGTTPATAPATAPTTAPATNTTATGTTPATAPATTPATAPATTPATTPAIKAKDERIKGNTNDGVIGDSAEGSAEIDKIDTANKENWVSVYKDPPTLVIKASLYAFIAFNSSDVCDTFNMTMNAVEQREIKNGSYAYHVVTWVNCTRKGVDETKGRFVLNFLPEGDRLLLTECGHREEGEIVNWLRITDEVPQCMTPNQRKSFLSQRLNHIQTVSDKNNATDPVQTNFFAKFRDIDGKQLAIFGSASVGFLAVVAIILVFVARKRKAQRDLERTIAGAKAEHAAEDDKPVVAEAEGTVERKGLMDSAKAKPTELEEGSFVNSPSVKV